MTEKTSYGFEFTQDLLEYMNMPADYNSFKNPDGPTNRQDDFTMSDCYSIRTRMIYFSNGDEHSGYTEQTHTISPLVSSTPEERMELAKAYTTVFKNQARVNNCGLTVKFNSVEAYLEDRKETSVGLTTRERAKVTLKPAKSFENVIQEQQEASQQLEEMMLNFVEEAYNYEIKLAQALEVFNKSANQPT